MSDELTALIHEANRAMRELEAAVADVRQACDLVPGEVPPSWRATATHPAPPLMQ